MDEGKPSVLARLFVLNEADVAGREVGVGGECRQDGFNSGVRGDVPQDDGCQNMQTCQCECKTRTAQHTRGHTSLSQRLNLDYQHQPTLDNFGTQ